MKITIDTTNKTISVEETVNFGELIKELEKLIPDYKSYSINQSVLQYQYWPTYPMYQYPYTERTEITCTDYSAYGGEDAYLNN